MKTIPDMQKFCLLLIASLLTFLPAYAEKISVNANEAEEIASEAYIYGYPLITMDLAKQIMTNVPQSGLHSAPQCQFSHATTFKGAANQDVSHSETLESNAWLDLKKEPYVLNVPQQKDRYFSLTLTDAWTNVIETLGSRKEAGQSSSYAITGPNWKGTLPKGLKEIKSPTNLVWIQAHTHCDGSADDYKAVASMQNEFSLTPLSAYGKTYTPPIAKINPHLDMQTTIRDQVNQLDILTFLKKLSILLKDNPPTPNDKEVVDKLAKIGIKLGSEFDVRRLDTKTTLAIENAYNKALNQILNTKKEDTQVNGWAVREPTSLEANYLKRAHMAAFSLGALLPEDLIVTISQTDKEGAKLQGINTYILHFTKEEMPPVSGFWSISVNDNDGKFIPNELNRHGLSSTSNLFHNEDGSLDIYLQNKSPGSQKEDNWIPIPQGDFLITMKLHWPRSVVLSGDWVPPPIEKNNSSEIENLEAISIKEEKTSDEVESESSNQNVDTQETKEENNEENNVKPQDKIEDKITSNDNGLEDKKLISKPNEEIPEIQEEQFLKSSTLPNSDPENEEEKQKNAVDSKDDQAPDLKEDQTVTDPSNESMEESIKMNEYENSGIE